MVLCMSLIGRIHLSVGELMKDNANIFHTLCNHKHYCCTAVQKTKSFIHVNINVTVNHCMREARFLCY